MSPTPQRRTSCGRLPIIWRPTCQRTSSKGSCGWAARTAGIMTSCMARARWTISIISPACRPTCRRLDYLMMASMTILTWLKTATCRRWTWRRGEVPGPPASSNPYGDRPTRPARTATITSPPILASAVPGCITTTRRTRPSPQISIPPPRWCKSAWSLTPSTLLTAPSNFSKPAPAI